MFDTFTPYGTAFPDRYNIYQGDGVIIAYAERWNFIPRGGQETDPGPNDYREGSKMGGAPEAGFNVIPGHIPGTDTIKE